jgi:hypothetical protein
MDRKRPRRRTKARGPAAYYDPSLIVDAPEHYSYARAFGVLTSRTWDTAVRPADHRIREFLSAFPPSDPARYLAGGELRRRPDGHFDPGTSAGRLERFLSDDDRPGSLRELLARYGLKLRGTQELRKRPFLPGPLRETAQRRNLKLRVLHGTVDIEPSNMDAAKAEYLDREEKKQAAADVREALRRMHAELAPTKR